MRTFLARPALAGLLCLAASGAVAGSDPRTDATSGWTTQEWPQDGQNDASNRAFDAPFRAAQYQYLSGKYEYPESWRWMAWTPTLGELPTEYMPGLNTIPQGPYGVMEVYLENKDKEKYLVILRTRDGTYIQGIKKSCRPVGTPVLIGNGSTLTVIALDCDNLKQDTYGIGFKQTLTPPPLPTIIYSYVQKSHSSGFFPWKEAGKGVVNFGPKASGGQVYFSVDLRTEKKPGFIHSVLWETMTEKWKVPLQSGSGLDKPIPRGQPPPASEEIYQATTPVAIRGALAVVGAVRMRKDKDYKEESDPLESALFAFNTIDGAQRWVYKITKTGKIVPTPAMLEDSIVFGTTRGRFYSVGNDGKGRWQTSEEGRVRTVAKPWNAPSTLEDVTMHGPAVDRARINAYFGGSDGRIYRVGVRSGSITGSEPLAYYIDPDENQTTYRSFTISTPPAIAEGSTGDFLATIISTRNLKPIAVTSTSYIDNNASALVLMSIPEMARASTGVTRFFESTKAYSNIAYFDPTTTKIIKVTTIPPPTTTDYFGACLLTGSMVPKFDYTRNLAYFDTEEGYRITIEEFKGFYGKDTKKVPDGFVGWNPNNPGGVSISNGFIYATDQAGNILALRSWLEHPPFSTVGLTVPSPGPYIPPFTLGPVQVYPNPFRPDKAFGGTAKFRNLPRGSRVELYTLAYERVRLLTESGFRADWDGRNDSGQIVAAGIYHYVITIPDQPAIRGKLALIRR